MLWCSNPKGRGSIPGWAPSSFTLVSEWKKPLGRKKKVGLFNNWRDVVMVRAAVHQAQGGEPKGARIDSQLGQEHFQVGFRASGKKGLESCNRFEELNK